MRKLQGSKVLVTGGLGFIGSHLVRRLLKEKCEVHVFGSGSRQNVADVSDILKIHDVDLRKQDAVRKAVSRIMPEKIFHLAANVNVSRNISQEEMLGNNFNGTVNLLKAAEAVDYDCFINTGTCEEYGNAKAPFSEGQEPRPVSPYSESKVRTTSYCIDYQKRTGRPVSVLRPFLTYGPFQKNRFFVPYVITSVLFNRPISTTKGEQTREFNYVEDIVDGFILASQSDAAVGEIINVGNGREYAIKFVLKKILGLMDAQIAVDYSLPYRDNEIMHLFCTNEKARKILKWQPRTSLEYGLKKTIAWYRAKFGSGEIEKWMA